MSENMNKHILSWYWGASGNKQIPETENISFDEGGDFDELLESYEQTEDEENAIEKDAGITIESSGDGKIRLEKPLSTILDKCLDVCQNFGTDILISSRLEEDTSQSADVAEIGALGADTVVVYPKSYKKWWEKRVKRNLT